MHLVYIVTISVFTFFAVPLCAEEITFDRVKAPDYVGVSDLMGEETGKSEDAIKGIEEWIKAIGGRRNREQYDTLVAKNENGQIIAFAIARNMLHSDGLREHALVWLKVKKEYQGQGIGRTLVEWTERRAKSPAFNSLFAIAIDTRNGNTAESISFAQHLGFVQLGHTGLFPRYVRRQAAEILNRNQINRNNTALPQKRNFTSRLMSVADEILAGPISPLTPIGLTLGFCTWAHQAASERFQETKYRP